MGVKKLNLLNNPKKRSYLQQTERQTVSFTVFCCGISQMNSLFNLNQHFPLLLDNDHLVEAINIPFAGRRCGKKVENRVKMQMSNIFGEGASVGDPPTEHITYNQQDPFDLPPKKNKDEPGSEKSRAEVRSNGSILASRFPPRFLFFIFRPLWGGPKWRDCAA